MPIGLALQLLLDRFVQQKNQVWLFVAIFAGCLTLFPTPFKAPSRPRIVLPAVRALPKIGGDGKWGLIADSAISFCNYSDPIHCKPIEILWMKAPADIPGFLSETDTRLLLVGARLMHELSPDWRRFVEELMRNPKGRGWRLVEMTPGFLIYARVG
jgi:hypothetical protein